MGSHDKLDVWEEFGEIVADFALPTRVQVKVYLVHQNYRWFIERIGAFGVAVKQS